MASRSCLLPVSSWIRSTLVAASAAICLFTCPPAALAQSPRGGVTGVVSDSGGGVLQGARVELQPSGSFAPSNNQGSFSINDVPPGTYKLVISFIGFTPFTRDLTVTAGQIVRADVTLQVAGANQQILVTAERVHGEAESINRERTAENILQVLPAEVITSLPNANVADAIGRLPGVTLERDEGEGKYVQIRGTEPRYSNVTIDGNTVASPESGVRQIKLDIVPSDLVESVEISKTLLANQDGDAIGGSVNLRTKTAGDRPTVSLFGLGGYTPIIGGRGEDQFGGTVGQRFGRQKRLGILFGGTYDWNGRGIDDLEPAPSIIQCDTGNCGSPSANAPNFGTYGTEDLREYRYYRGRYGFAGSADYRLNDNSQIYIRGLYSHFDNFGDRWVFSPQINSFTDSPFHGGTDGSISSNAQIRRPVQQVGSLLAGGRHVFGNSSFTWEFSTSRSSSEDKGYSTTNFGPVDPNSPLNNIQYNVDLTARFRPKLTAQNGVNLYDASQYFLQNLDANHTYSPQLNLQGSASYNRYYGWNGHLGSFEFGARLRNAHKFQNSDDRYYDAVDPGSLPMSNFLGTFSNSNYYDKSFTLGSPLVDYTKITSFFNSTPGAFLLNADTTHQRNDSNNFDLIERVTAGYLMNSINFGRFRLYTGLRFEGTTENVLGYKVSVDTNGNYLSTTPQRQNSGYVDILPSAELRYALTPDSALRLAYGRGIARPNFVDLTPYTFLNDKRNSIDIGNPALLATHANNYDLLYEHYLNPLGVIQGGFFYKSISDPIYSVGTIVPSGVYQGYTQTQPVNGSSAYVYGFEAAYQQRLAFLPGFLSALGISANYGYTASRANGVPGRSDHPALQRQAPHTWNISPTYDRGRVSIRLGVSYNDANIFQYNYSDGTPLGLKGPGGDIYLYEHLQVDAQGSVRLAKGFSAIVYGLNVNNEPFGFYQGSSIWPIQREYYQPTVAAGLRWSLSQER